MNPWAVFFYGYIDTHIAIYIYLTSMSVCLCVCHISLFVSCTQVMGDEDSHVWGDYQFLLSAVEGGEGDVGEDGEGGKGG